MKSEILHIAIAFDQNYLKQFYALITSIFANNSDNIVHIHTIASGLSEDEKRKIQNFISSQKSEIVFYEIEFNVINSFVLSNNWTLAVYYRLFFPLLVKNVPRLLYIDTDTLVIGDLSELFSLNLNNFPVGAVYDNYVKTQELIGISEEGKYFNSGVLLIDIYKWNLLGISERAITFLNNYPEKIRFVDQCALNAVLIDNWFSLDPKYNRMYSYLPNWEEGSKPFWEIIKKTSILHFTLQRPWNILCRNRGRKLYEKYLNHSISNDKTIWNDFQLTKIIPYYKMKISEIYFDNTFLKYIIKILK